MDRFKEFLKSLGYTDEQITAVVNGMKEQKIYLSNEENIDERYIKLKGKYETQKTELETANDTITELKKTNPDVEGLQTKIKEYEKTIETMGKDAQQKEFDLALENELIKLNVHSTKAARAELDMDKIKYENGQFTGLKEQTDTWVTDKTFLIKTGQTKTLYNPAGGEGGTTSLAATIATQRNAGHQVQTNNPYANAWDVK